MTNENIDILRKFSIETIDEVPNDYEISLDIQLIESTVTTDRPGRIQITMSNHSTTEQAFTTGYMKVFGEVWSVETNPGLVLLPPEMPLEFEDYQLRPTDQNIAFDAAELINRIQPGESESIQYDIWDAPQNNGEPLKPGTYRFQSEYARFSSDGESEDSFIWGFTLSIAEP